MRSLKHRAVNAEALRRAQERQIDKHREKRKRIAEAFEAKKKQDRKTQKKK